MDPAGMPPQPLTQAEDTVDEHSDTLRRLGELRIKEFGNMFRSKPTDNREAAQPKKPGPIRFIPLPFVFEKKAKMHTATESTDNEQALASACGSKPKGPTRTATFLLGMGWGISGVRVPADQVISQHA